MILLVAAIAYDLRNISLVGAILMFSLLGLLALVYCLGGVSSGIVLTHSGASFSLFSLSSMYSLLPSSLFGF